MISILSLSGSGIAYLSFAVVMNRTLLRSKVFGYAGCSINDKFKALTTDAAREEVMGKTINLMEGRGSAVPAVFKVVIAAQVIRDLEGVIAKLNSTGTVVNHTATSGSFDATIIDKDGKGSDPDRSIYFDEILGESRMLVTIERLHYFDNDTPRARLRVRQIEYLD